MLALRSSRVLHRLAVSNRRSLALDAHALNLDEGAQYNPEWQPNGNEGGVNTNKLPWLPVAQMPGCSIKVLRVSKETGAFTSIVKVPKGTTIPTHVHLGASDTYILSGKLSYNNGPMKGSIGPGTWGYAPSGAKMAGTVAEEDTEYLASFYGPVAFLNGDGKVQDLLTGPDVRAMANKAGMQLLPNTLAEAMKGEQASYDGPAEPLALSDAELRVLNTQGEVTTELTNPHYVDTNKIPWIINPDAPDIALKVMRVSAETGTISMIVRQNGQAPPHYHLGPADFFITSGRIGYRAGPKEGYGPGTYMYEPAGARHDATQRVPDCEEDLIYTANVWGPIQFDSGVGTPVAAVFSWMQYLEAAQAFQSPLIASTFPNDQSTLLASNN